MIAIPLVASVVLLGAVVILLGLRAFDALRRLAASPPATKVEPAAEGTRAS